MPLSAADQIWNRATLNAGGGHPREGDSALAGLLSAHGLICNGGVLHAVEVLASLNEGGLEKAQKGYRTYGYQEIPRLLQKANDAFESDRKGICTEDMEKLERDLDEEYWALITDDEHIAARFGTHLAEHPELYAPP